MQTDDDKKKKASLEKFHEQNLKFVEEQKRKDLQRHQQRMEDLHGFDERGKAAIAEEAELMEEKKEQTREWRAGEKERKTEIIADKKRKKAQAAEIVEERKKKHDYEEKQHKYFESMRAATAEKTTKERKLYEKDQELKAEVLRIERVAREAKSQADSEELRSKNDIERESLRKRDAINREFRDLEQKLHSDEARQKAQFQGMGPAGKQRLDELATALTKKRADLQNDEQTKRRQLEQETVKKKNEAEAKTRKRKADIDRELYEKKADISRQREKLHL